MSDPLHRDDQFEYNDGLGDMLREKQRQEFSWIKTLSFFVGVAILILIAVALTFNMGGFLFKAVKPLEEDVAETPQPVTVMPVIDESVNEPPVQPDGAMPAAATAASAVTAPQTQPAASVVQSAPIQPVSSPAVTKPLPKPVAPQAVALAKPPAPKISKVSMVKKPAPKPTARRVMPVKPAPTPTVAKAAAPFKVIAGAFSQYDNAKQLVKQLANKHIDSFVLMPSKNSQAKAYRVQVGAFSTHQEAKQFSDTLQRNHKISTFISSKIE